MKTVVIGCTPLAKKVINLLENTTSLVGVVNLHPSLGMLKSNYETLSDYNSSKPDNFFVTKDINNDDTYNWIKSKNCDVIIQCGWSQIFNKRLINIPNLFCIGFHPSPLPIGRGAAVLNWIIIKNKNMKDIEWGNSMFIMDEKTDTGDVLDFEPIKIESRDNIQTSFFKVDKSSIKMLKRTLPKIKSGKFIRKTQDNSKATRFYKRKPSDGLIDFSWDGNKILNYIRALTFPYPGAFFKYNSNYLINIWKASWGKNDYCDYKIGEILEIKYGKGIRIKVGENNSIWIELISDKNGLECWADDWVKENNLSEGDIL